MKTQDHLENREQLRLFKAGDAKFINTIYKCYYPKFESHFVRQGYDPDDLKEAYDDAIFDFYRRLRKKKKFVLRNRFETYLFKMAHNKLEDNITEKENLFAYDDSLLFGTFFEEINAKDERLAAIKKFQDKLLKKLTPFDRKIIKYFYVKHYHWDFIAKKTGKSKYYLKNRKSKIIKQLNEFKQEGMDIIRGRKAS